MNRKHAASKHMLKRALTTLLALCFAITTITAPVSAAIGVNVNTPTQQQIREKMLQIYQNHDFKVTYTQKPVYKGPGYVPGVLSDETLSGAVDVLNGMRYIAGIPSDVKLSPEYVKMAQAGALVNAANGDMDHRPKKPADMDDSLYQLGYKGCSSSNLNWYADNFKEAVEGWIADNNNVSGFNQGHRRWCLNPTMQYTGFGRVDDFNVMYAFDRFNESTPYTGVAWPAQQMPLDFFNEDIAWSISFGRPVNQNAAVTLTRTRDNKVWNFSNSASDGDFLVENTRYGQQGCVIFLPKNVGMYKPGDVFHVQVTENGSIIADYDVTFFELQPVEKITLDHTTLTMPEYGEAELNATVYPANASDDTLYWKSSNPKVVKLYEGYEGYLESGKKGTAVITARNKYGNVVASCKVKVVTAREYYKPAKTSIKTLSAGKNHSIKVSWNKVSCSGYQIRYATNSSFKNYKTVRVSGKSNLTKTIKNLKKGKTYYVKVRAYRNHYYSTYYGAFSDVKKIRCK